MFNIKPLLKNRKSINNEDNSEIEVLDFEDNYSDNTGDEILVDEVDNSFSETVDTNDIGHIVINEVVASKIFDDTLENKESSFFKDDVNFSKDVSELIKPVKQVSAERELEVGKNQKNIMRKSAELTKIELVDLVKLVLDVSKFDMETKSLVNSFSERYINYKYFFEGDFNPLLVKSDLEDILKKELEAFSLELMASRKYNPNLVRKVKNAFLVINSIDFQDADVDDILSKNNISLEEATMVKKLISNYNRTYNDFMKKLDNRIFSLVLVRYGLTDTYISNVKAKIKFNTIFSKEGIDKAFNSSLVQEDMKNVQLKLLSIKVFEDWLNFSLKQKYMIYLPSSLYKKSRKIHNILSSIDDSYSQNKICMIVDYDILINHEKMIKHLAKKGFHFVLDCDAKKIIDNKKISSKQLCLFDSVYLYNTDKESLEKLKNINNENKEFIYVDDSLLELEGGVIS